MIFCLRAFITKFKFKIGIKEQYGPNIDPSTPLNIAGLLAQTSSLNYSYHLAHPQLSVLNHIGSKINTGLVKKAISQITPYVTVRGQA